MAEFTLTPGQENIRQMMHYIAKERVRPLALQADKDGKYPDDFLLELQQMGIHGGAITDSGDDEKSKDSQESEKKESQGFRMAAIASEELAWGDPALILSLPGPGLGGPPVRMMGTPEQKEKFFGVFKSPGLHYGAYATTEPGAGSDVSAISTTAKKDGDYYILNGVKCFITNGAKADWTVIFATVDKSLGRAGHRAFVVEKGTPGFRVGKIEEKLGLKASETAELVLENCRVPVFNLLGGEEYYSQKAKGGFKGAMKTFDATRPLVAAMAVGIARAAYEIGEEFLRKHFGAKAGYPRYRYYRDRLARVKAKIDAARLAVWKAVWMADIKKPNTKEASIAKILGPEAAEEATREVISIMGPYGLLKENYVEKLYRDQKVYNIFEGTGQIQRIVISRRLQEQYA
ncbi:MAG: acyl-CoA dehydrogenase [Planctomycetota bacterium]|nr:MAG: acyl-CoA dehydrogenase [Planctomycetota bacterium]